jgi:hypothetical protein
MTPSSITRFARILIQFLAAAEKIRLLIFALDTAVGQLQAQIEKGRGRFCLPRPG